MAPLHQIAALVGLCTVAWTYYRVWLNIAANQDVIARIVDQVRQIRAARGLDEAPQAAASSAG